MIRCVAIYPHPMSEEYAEKVRKTIGLAVRYGFTEVFTTIHLPEYSLDQQLDAFEMIAGYAKEKGLEVTVDIGGPFFDRILNSEKDLNRMKEIPFDFVRLDYGYDAKQIQRLYEELDLSGFVLNASMFDKEEILRQVKILKQIDPKMEIRTCHNFYPRKDTGLDEVFAIRQDSYFRDLGIPVYYCVPTHSNPRGPLYEGLCTLEKHRYAPLREILCDLYLDHHIEALMMSDEWLSEEEFMEVDRTLSLLSEPLNETIEIGVLLAGTITGKEKEIVLQEHAFRYDSGLAILRSRSSRQMAEFASAIEKNDAVEREAGAITIDNSLYKRYSGELQVVLKKQDADERVNVIGKVKDSDDLIRLARFREGIRYVFVEAEE